jgi:hypothetical protein
VKHVKHMKAGRPLLSAFLLCTAVLPACDGAVAPVDPACTGQVAIDDDSLVLTLGSVVSVAAFSDVQCGATRPALAWLVRDPAVASVVEIEPDMARVTATGGGQTYVVARAGGERGKADSVRVRVLVPPRLTVLSGAGQTDTVDAVLRDSLVVEVRDPLTGQPLAGVPVFFQQTPPPPGTGSFRRGRVAPAGPGGRELQAFIDTTNIAGRAATAVKLVGPDPGPGYLLVSLPFQARPDSVAFTVLPGRAASVRVVPRDSGTIIGGTLQLRAESFDRRGNALGPVAATYTQLPPGTTVDLSSDGRVTGLRFGQARVVAVTAQGVDTAWVRVLPPDLVAGRNALGGLILTRLDGSGYTAVGSAVMVPGQGRVDWSPDGSTLAFTGRYPGSLTPHIFLAGLDGSSRPLVPGFEGSAGEVMPRFSPDGQFVFFSARAAGGGSEIWRASVATGQPERVGPEAGSRVDAHPSISPDGRFVAFIRDAASARDIVILDLLDGSLRSTGRSGSYVSWSPVDSLLAFSPGTSSVTALALMRPDGSLVDVHADWPYATPYAWSRDGRFLLNSAYVMDAMTGEVLAPTVRIWDADWRPH